jgi:hypothetical protein
VADRHLAISDSHRHWHESPMTTPGDRNDFVERLEQRTSTQTMDNETGGRINFAVPAADWSISEEEQGNIL